MDADARFCGRCGHSREEAAAKQTLFGMPQVSLPVGGTPQPPGADASQTAPAAPQSPAASGFAPVASPASPAASAQPSQSAGQPTGAAPAQGTPAKKAPQKTMLGMMAPPIAAPGGVPAAIQKNAPIDPKRTMMGMPASPLSPGVPTAPTSQEAAPAPQVQPHPAPEAQAQAAPSSATPGAKTPAKTMMGMMAPVAPAPADAKGGLVANRTMFGMPATAPPSAAAQPPAAARPAAPSPSAPEPAQAQPQKPAAVPAAQTNRTMLGVMVAPPGAAAPPNTPAPAASAPAAQTNRTMLGQAAPTAPGAVAASPTSEPMPREQVAAAAHGGAYAGGDTGGEEVAVAGVRRGGFSKVLAVLLVLSALGAAAFGAYLFLQQGPDVRASVTRGEEGEQLRLEIAGAPEGTKVRFGGTEVPLEAGAASFPLSADALHLGENELSVDVVSPGGDVTTSTLLLALNYRVRPDLSALEQAEPLVRILVDAVAGTTVTLDEQPVSLDESGHAAVDFSLDAVDGAVFERTFHYRVVAPGASPEDGTLQVRVPLAALQVLRPLPEVVTDRELVEVSGAVHERAQVTINGEEAMVNGGRFVASVPLPSLGTHRVEVVARRQGRAPRRQVVTIRRVASLADEAEALAVDRSLSYARVAASPDTYRGRLVAMTGRVFNAGEGPDGPMMQLVVDDCPRGQRCPLWVDFDGAMPIELNQQVRVFGSVEGEQQYRTSDGDVRRSPRVRARIVLPAGRRR